MTALSLGFDGTPELLFHPVVDLRTGRLAGFEALLRWNDPELGQLTPDFVIPKAEHYGQMDQLNAWVLAEACAQAAAWDADFEIAVNCSVFQLRRGTTAPAAAAALEATQLDPRRLTVEVTEYAVRDETAAADLRALARLGVRLSVDDVGVDHSFLGTLPDRHVDCVKVARSLIAQLNQQDGVSSDVTVEAIIFMAHGLGLSVVAEGVETAEQLTSLLHLDADAAQGYFFSVPIAASEARAVTAMRPHPVFVFSAGNAPAAAHEIPTASTTERSANPRHAVSRGG